MRFVFTADLHLTGYYQDKLVNNLPERLLAIKTTIYNIANYCVQNEIENFIIGGDLLHNKSVIYSLALNTLLDFFRDFPKINFYLIDGNHDLSGRGVENVVSSIRVFNEPNVKRFENVERIENIVFIPYSHKVVENVRKNKGDFLVSHFGLNDAVLSSGISIVSDLGIRDLEKKYKVCLLGHYHKPQEIESSNTKVYYVGSPVQLDWGEKHEEKRFLVVDTETYLIESVPTTGFKKFFEFEVTKENKVKVLEEAKKLSEEGHYVRIVSKDKDTNWKEISKEISLENSSIVFVDRSEVDITNRGITTTMSTEKKLERFLQIKGVPEEKWKLYKEKAFSIISSCEEKGVKV